MMYRPALLTVVVASLLLTSLPADAAKEKKAAKKGQNSSARTINRFDRNHDGSLDSKEADGVRNTYNAIKKLDTNGDGQLSDSEISAAKVTQRKAGKRGKKKGNV
jgi:hypothetical protein